MEIRDGLAFTIRDTLDDIARQLSRFGHDARVVDMGGSNVRSWQTISIDKKLYLIEIKELP